jgi:hypothetical protein
MDSEESVVYDESAEQPGLALCGSAMMTTFIVAGFGGMEREGFV